MKHGNRFVYFILGTTAVVAFCSIIYELLLAQSLTILFGGSVERYSITIGLYLFSLGLGAMVPNRFSDSYLVPLVIVEIILSLVGSLSIPMLFVFSGKLYDYPSVVQIFSYATIICVGFLSGMEIPLLTRLIELERFNKILSFDYFGALIGTIAFAHLFYPKVGLISTAMYIGFINLIVALSYSYFLESTHPKKRLLQSVCWLLIFIFLGLISQSKTLDDWVIRYYKQSWLETDHLTESYKKQGRVEIIDSFQTKYQDITFAKITDKPYPDEPPFSHHALFLDRMVQLNDFMIYEYHQGFPLPALLYSPLKDLRIAIIGGGDGLLMKTLLDTGKVSHIDHIDIDTDFVTYMKNHSVYGQMTQNIWQSPSIHFYNRDAFSFMREQSLKKKNDLYDLIFFDLSGLTTDKLLSLYSEEFFEFNLKRLKPDGVFAMWIYHTPKFTSALQTTLYQAGFRFQYDFCTPAKNYFTPDTTISPRDNCVETFSLFSVTIPKRQKNDAFPMSDYQKNMAAIMDRYFFWDYLYPSNVPANSVFKPNYAMIHRREK